MELIIHEIHKTSLPDIKSWGKTLMKDRKDDAIASMEEEGVRKEAMFVFGLGGKTYILGITTKENEDTNAADMSKDINVAHKKVFTSAIKNARVSKPELVYQLERS